MTTYPADPAAHFNPSRACFDAVVNKLMGERACSMDHGAVEALVDSEGREILRRLLEDHLALRAAQEEREALKGNDGVVRGHMRSSHRSLGSLFGVVLVSRLALTGRGAKGGLRPLDAELNMPAGKYSFGVRRRASELVASVPYDTAVDRLNRTTGAKVAKRQVEDMVIHAANDFGAFYASQELVTTTSADLLVLSFDGKGVVMRPEGLRPTTRKAAQTANDKLARRRSPGEKPRKRMAEVAAIYEVARNPRTAAQVMGTAERDPAPRPTNKRVWASVVDDASSVIWKGFAEAARRDPAIERPWVALVDGNPHQLRQIRAHAADLGADITIVVDFIHVAEYIWKAAWALFDKGDPAAEAWVEVHIQRILQGRSHVVVQALRQSVTKRKMASCDAKPLEKAANYLHKLRDYIRYDAFLEAGLPIATGVIEGACRHLVKDRMDVTGARWGLEGAEAVLRLRALKSSGDLDRYWDFHHRRELERNHLKNYAADEMSELRAAA
jgi:hypothetical protein